MTVGKYSNSRCTCTCIHVCSCRAGRACVPGAHLALTTATNLKMLVEYGAYENMTGPVGTLGSKKLEFKSLAGPWLKMLLKNNYRYIHLYAGGHLGTGLSNTVWVFGGWRIVNLLTDTLEHVYYNRTTGQTTVGPYANGYHKVFQCDDARILAITLGPVVARHYTATDTKTWKYRPHTQKGYVLVKKKHAHTGVCVGCR
jgi:hypothetical protein